MNTINYLSTTINQLLALMGATLLTVAPAIGGTLEEKGLTIATEMDQRDTGWQDSAATVNMLLRNRAGETSNRKLRIEFLEVIEKGAGDKSMVVFDEPRDIKGTAFLTHSRIHTEDNQWLYLPALKRVKRISSANKSGPFVGSEFAYEDLIADEVDKYNYKWIEDTPCGKLQCFAIERYPVYNNSGYSRQVVWIDKDEYRRIKIDYYDKKQDLLKTLNYTAYQQYMNKYWRAQQLTMTNHQTGKSTQLEFGTYTFQAGLDDKSFSRNRLKRAH